MYIHRHTRERPPTTALELSQYSGEKEDSVESCRLYMEMCLPSFSFFLSSFVFVTQSIAYDRNRNVKFFDPSRDTPIFHSCPKSASHPFSREKSHISLSEIYRMFLQKFRDLGQIIRIAKKRNCWFLFCFSSCRKLARFINFKIIRLKIINL